jgi:hypothetical protein
MTRKVYILHYQSVYPDNSLYFWIFNTYPEAKSAFKEKLLDIKSSGSGVGWQKFIGYLRVYSASDKIYAPVTDKLIKDRGVGYMHSGMDMPSPMEIFEYQDWEVGG